MWSDPQIKLGETYNLKMATKPLWESEENHKSFPHKYICAFCIQRQGIQRLSETIPWI